MLAIGWLMAASAVWQQSPQAPTRPDSAPDSVQAAAATPAPIGPAIPAAFPRVEPIPAQADSTASQRPRAIEYSDAYGVRMAIHRYASYATIPLFVAEFALGQSLYNNPPGSSSTAQAHRLVAAGVAGLFVVNTVTGTWGLWDSRKDPAGRLRRYLHSALLIASDAGFVATGATAPSSRRFAADPSQARVHRTIAIASMGTALAGYVMMLLWKN